MLQLLGEHDYEYCEVNHGLPHSRILLERISRRLLEAAKFDGQARLSICLEGKGHDLEQHSEPAPSWHLAGEFGA